MFEDIKGEKRNHISKKDKILQWPNEKEQKDKQPSIKHYTEN
jgi:hypothetical protein